MNKGEYDNNAVRYIPGTLKLMFKECLKTKQQKSKLPTCYTETWNYTNLNGFYICFPIKIKKAKNVNNDIDDDLITVNNFFAHWIK